METETLDKLYLEWSQFTRARNAREIRMAAALSSAPDIAMYQPDEFFKHYTVWFEKHRRQALRGADA